MQHQLTINTFAAPCHLTLPATQKLVEELKGRPGLIEVDISGGLEENIPIPLFNDVNNRKLDPGFSYIADMTFAPGAREQVSWGFRV